MLHTQVPTAPIYVSASETALLGDAAEDRRFDRNPHEYFDSFCDERGKTAGARMQQNPHFSEIERQRSMGCERPRVYSSSTELRQRENRRNQGNGERSNSNQNISESQSA